MVRILKINERITRQFEKQAKEITTPSEIFPDFESIQRKIQGKLGDLKDENMNFCEFVIGDRSLGRETFFDWVSNIAVEENLALCRIEIDREDSFSYTTLEEQIRKKIVLPPSLIRKDENLGNFTSVIESRDIIDISNRLKESLSGLVIIIDNLERIFKPIETKVSKSRREEIENSLDAIFQLRDCLIQNKLKSTGLFLGGTQELWHHTIISSKYSEKALYNPSRLIIGDNTLLMLGKLFLKIYDKKKQTSFENMLSSEETFRLFEKKEGNLYIDFHSICGRLDKRRKNLIPGKPTKSDKILIENAIKAISSKDKTIFTKREKIREKLLSKNINASRILIDLLEAGMEKIEDKFDREFRKELMQLDVRLEGKYPNYKISIEGHPTSFNIEIRKPYIYGTMDGIPFKENTAKAIMKKISERVERVRNATPKVFDDDAIIEVFSSIVNLIKATNIKNVIEIDEFLDVTNLTLLKLGCELIGDEGVAPMEILREKLSKHKVWSSLYDKGIRFETGRVNEERGIVLEKLNKNYTIMVLTDKN